jgi:hypothetical protein
MKDITLKNSVYLLHYNINYIVEIIYVWFI